MIDDDIIRDVADKHDLDVHVVEDLIEYMWHLVIRCFNDDRFPKIMLPGLGTFHIKSTKLKKLVRAMDKPDWKHNDKENAEEYRKRIRKIYERRLKEEYLWRSNKEVPVSLRDDINNLKNGSSS